ncbi:hypothetical protein DUY81_06215 [Acidipropionibacterium acidipropionici]|jgi:threonine dehydrogenase-like Zn-dependent dehydrogenase|uniref:Uncharacterized protein n=1 Tax=Acidipropionibacterium acidipropionici TaxID=1748 RepID=A0AAC8YEI3_9ACTN|nr:hypothetical protein [Acidipropionibacterium acidipropionici]AMS05010.1 hypothetical protein AXH35_05560 [Acidipropionibacterium acidipropionici]AOZ46490.1 hypothetical protein A8L58_07025 [Acidipropionibacterium acidipropionici]AZP37460.1 hypothetical protein DUY81_06215 [Acidipropionibacterium acidipropionici]QCV94500.1 hypothetical protein FEZ30_03735 [Acidipropionibacterium acidipropionici]
MSHRSIDVGAFIWGLMFIIVAGLGVALALGAHLLWRDIIRIGPVVLIGVGALGLLLTIITKGHRR